MRLRRMGWRKYETTISAIAKGLTSIGVQFDVIVGIARAGLPVLTSLTSRMSIRDVGILVMQRTVSDEPFSAFLPEARLLSYALPAALEDRSVLLVDNVVHSGKTASKAAALLREKGAGRIVCAALARYEEEYPFQVVAPIKLSQDDWVIWPWEHQKNNSLPYFGRSPKRKNLRSGESQ